MGAQTFVRNIEQPVLQELSHLFANHRDLRATDTEIMARFFLSQHCALHYRPRDSARSGNFAHRARSFCQWLD